MTEPLKGIRVIELGSWVFVPSAATVLAEWGADVIKVESPDGGDPMRGMTVRDKHGQPRMDAVDRMNHNKRSIGIDLKNPRGREILLDLCRGADVFMTNWLPSARRRAGVDLADIRSASPSIIYARGSGYGQKGPEANRGALDVTAYWARSGAAHYYTQPPETATAPIIAPSVGDLVAGQTLAGGIAAALLQRERTGEPSVVDVSLFGEGIYGMSGEISRRQILGEPPESVTRANTPNPIVNQYRTADNRVIQLAFTQPSYWPTLMTLFGRPDLASDQRYSTAQALYENRVDAIAALDAEFAKRTCAEWEGVLAKLDRGWEVVRKAVDVCDDPQVEANGYVAYLERSGESVPIVRNPVQFDETLPEFRRAPDAGEQTDDILAELGLDWDAIIDLKVAGAVL